MNLIEGNGKLTVKLNDAEHRLLGEWSHAAFVYPGTRAFDSDFIRFKWFECCGLAGTGFEWVSYGELGTLGSIPILGVIPDRARYYIAYADGKGLNVLEELLFRGHCLFVDIPSLEARLKEAT